MAYAGSIARELRPSFLDWGGQAFATAVVCALTLFMLGVAVVVIGQSILLSLFMLLLAGFLAFLAWLVGREAAASMRTRITIQGDQLRLVLPAKRGYAELPPLDGWLPLSAIARLEVREEAYRAWGMTTIQTVYALAMKGGDHLVLGADRPARSAFYGRAAEAIAAALQTQIADVGLYDGRSGPAMVGGNTAPGWNAAPLDAATAGKRRQGAALTWQIVAGMALLVVGLRACTAFMHH